MKIDELLKQINEYKYLDLQIDMTRGRPSPEQLDLSLPMMNVLNSDSDYFDADHNDTRNYGSLEGIPECKSIFASVFGTPQQNVLIFGNSSLNIMFDQISRSYSFGVCGSKPWCELKKIKWLCPVPGYDRHFAITEHFGFEMINIPMNDDGPDMDLIEEYIKDESVKGIWCVPKYSNPSGVTYSDEVVRRFANLKPAAPDFRIYWDNAYALQDFDGEERLLNIFDLAQDFGNPDIVYIFTSTSKISFPGSGVAAMAASSRNIADIKRHLSFQTICFDKINQLRHARFFRDLNGLKKHVHRHCLILKKKFDIVEQALSTCDPGIIEWTKPKGGYFVCIKVNSIAKEVIERCKDCGVKLTEAGCMHPYHLDSNNSYIRIAPSYLSEDQLRIAMEIVVLSIKIEELRKSSK